MSGNAKVLKGSAFFEEEGHGAHYYAYSPTLNTGNYTEAFANIVLPTKLNLRPTTTSAYTRNAYISFGIRGTTNAGSEIGVDMGLVRTQERNYWHPVIQDLYKDASGYQKGKEYSNFAAPNDATNALIVVKPVGNNKVGMYIQFLNAKGANTGSAFNEEFEVGAPRTWKRYYRFASLVPSRNVTESRSDETHMVGGKFINMGLYNKSRDVYEPWGINTGLVSNAWIMYHPKCQVTYTNNSDAFTIDHWIP